MEILTIDGHLLRAAIIHAVNNLEKNKEIVNSLNVFPVPDGDTGNNMTSTARSAAKAVIMLHTDDIYEVAKAAASGALRGARGNSGVILSQLFRGFAKGLEGKKKANSEELKTAFLGATEASYKAVMKPKEGTILTIGKTLAVAAEEFYKSEQDIRKFLEKILVAANKMLIKTEFMLPELRAAKVVDSGGKGLIYMLEGILEADFSKEPILEEVISSETSSYSNFSTDVDIEFAYCTEMFIDLSTGKDKLSFENIEEPLKKFLETQGDSIVVVGDESIVKIHIHTNDPGVVMQKSLTYGQLSNIKIENMRLQHEELVSFAPEIKTKTTEKKRSFEKGISVISVSSGDGFSDIFEGLGVGHVISGGQTMNPSAEDFLKAINSLNTEEIIILPNNSNVILAAEQASKMEKSKKVVVVSTKTIPEGITSMYNLNPDISAEKNKEAMIEAIKNTSTGEVTFAVRDTSIEGVEIKKDDMLCILDNKIINTFKTPIEAGVEIITKMLEKNPEFINIYYGDSASLEDALKLKEIAENMNKEAEVEVHSGGQPLYNYIISAE